ncbi:MAG: VOC family protein [Puniceicoccales bacterium]
MIEPKSSFPIYIIETPSRAIDFYKHLGFSVVFNCGWYVHLATESGVQIGFLEPNHPTQPEFLHSSFPGSGSLFTLEVENAEDAFQEAQALGLTIKMELTSEEWGQTHFILEDPFGLILDIVEPTEPSEEYAKQYASPE